MAAVALKTLDADEIVPGLYQGAKPPCGPLYGIDVLVLCAREYQPDEACFEGTLVVHAPFDDNPFGVTPADMKRVLRAVDVTVRAVQRGKRVLVTCQKGWNRSGLVTGLAIRRLYRMRPETVVSLIQRRRGPNALGNQSFVRLIERM